MADLNKANVQPNCTTTIKQHKKNKLKVPKKTNAGVPLKPKEDSQNVRTKGYSTDLLDPTQVESKNTIVKSNGLSRV